MLVDRLYLRCPILVLWLLCEPIGRAAVRELQAAVANQDEEFERVANSLRPGDDLILHGGTYSQAGRRALTVQGTADQPIMIRAADAQVPVLTRPAADINKRNNVEFVDCCYLVVRGVRFEGGSSGVRFIRGHHVTFEDCEISHTGNNALTMNSGNCDAFVIRNNHIHHTGLSDARPTEGEGMYIGCHDGSCITTNTLIEGNYIHHLRGTSIGGSDGIEIKYRSHGNIVRNNVIHNTNLARQYPRIFVYGGGEGVNIVEGNRIWNAGEGIQVVSDAIIRNNVVFDCTVSGITAAPHASVPRVRNVRVVNNTIVNHPVGVRIRWANAVGMVFSNNAVYCAGFTAIDASGIDLHPFRANYVSGRLAGARIDGNRFHDGGDGSDVFVRPEDHDYRLKGGSILVGRADPGYAPRLDVSGTGREPPFDVGAHEQGNSRKPKREE